MDNKILENNIRLILENKAFEKHNIELTAIPEKEGKIFLMANNLLPETLVKFTNLPFDKNEAQRWSLIYLALHDLFHSEINYSDIVKLEILTTAPIFVLTKNILDNINLTKLFCAYFLLGFTALKINHDLEYLISEKLILGEFFALGGIENNIWGFKIKHELLPEIVNNILIKTQKDRHNFLVKKYKNLAFDFL